MFFTVATLLWLAVLALAIVCVVFALGMFAGCWVCWKAEEITIYDIAGWKPDDG